jgi:hypothetical protein
VNGAAQTTAVAEPTAAASSTRADRLAALLPLAGVYVAFCFVYAVETWARVTPWLFTDELELTQLSRSIAATGHAARRGEAHSPDSLYTVLTAPLWLIHNVSTAYASIKYADVFAMTSVVFPTYFLARLVVGRRAALFAAAGAAAIPSSRRRSPIRTPPGASSSLRRRWWSCGAAAARTRGRPARSSPSRSGRP